MKFLSLDTSTQYSVVAISNENGLMYGLRRLFEKGRSDELIGLIQYCLNKTRLKTRDLDYFGIGVGPGSFTGLRIGLGTVKGLSYALKRPCLTFSSLDAIAYNRAPYRKERLCIMVDARRSNVYCCFYKINNTHGSAVDRLMRVSDDALLEKSVLWNRLKGDVAFSGDALKICREELQEESSTFQFLSEKFWYPTPESISALTLESLRSGQSQDCFGLSAVYLYEQDCQVDLKTLKGILK